MDCADGARSRRVVRDDDDDDGGDPGHVVYSRFDGVLSHQDDLPPPALAADRSPTNGTLFEVTGPSSGFDGLFDSFNGSANSALSVSGNDPAHGGPLNGSLNGSWSNVTVGDGAVVGSESDLAYEAELTTVATDKVLLLKPPPLRSPNEDAKQPPNEHVIRVMVCANAALGARTSVNSRTK
jgi:hypothetical protein